MAATETARFEGFIVGGYLASITDFPHVAFLAIHCVTAHMETYQFGCGSSILNQQLLITAAHCLIECTNEKTRISVNMGDENKLRGVRRYASSFVCHERYDPVTSGWDIAIVKMLKPVQFGLKIRRVAVMKSPPYSETGRVAGWGLTDEEMKLLADDLKQTDQIVRDRRDCLDLFEFMPKGTFCASSGNVDHFAAWGDSGSGLVVRGYILIGVVSYKHPAVANNVVVYTDIGFHYNWLEFNADRLCNTTI